MNPDKTAIEKLWEKHSLTDDGYYRFMHRDGFLAALSEAEREGWISVDFPRLALEIGQRCCYPSYEDSAEHWLDIAKVVALLKLRLRPAPPKEKP